MTYSPSKMGEFPMAPHGTNLTLLRMRHGTFINRLVSLQSWGKTHN